MLGEKLLAEGWAVRGTSRREEGLAAIEAAGIEAALADHGPRLERLMERLVDTPVRGVVYEATGSVDPALLEAGAEIVRTASRTWHIPVEIVTSEANQPAEWSQEMVDLALGLLSPARASK
jgi:hypothetical protein